MARLPGVKNIFWDDLQADLKNHKWNASKVSTDILGLARSAISGYRIDNTFPVDAYFKMCATIGLDWTKYIDEKEADRVKKIYTSNGKCLGNDISEEDKQEIINSKKNEELSDLKKKFFLMSPDDEDYQNVKNKLMDAMGLCGKPYSERHEAWKKLLCERYTANDNHETLKLVEDISEEDKQEIINSKKNWADRVKKIYTSYASKVIKEELGIPAVDNFSNYMNPPVEDNSAYKTAWVDLKRYLSDKFILGEQNIRIVDLITTMAIMEDK